MNRVPSTYELSRLEFCSADLYDINISKPSFFIPYISFSRGLEHLFSMKIGYKGSRHNMLEFVNSHIVEAERKNYTKMYNTLLDIMINTNKKTPIVKQNILLEYDFDNGLKVNCNVHYAYSRKEGPCYGIVLSDTFHSKDLNEEEILTHIMTCGAILADYDRNKELIRFIEIIAFYNNGNDWDKFIIRIGPEQESLIEYAKASLLKNTRRYYLEEKSHSNWSNKCIWCPQETRCSGIGHWREYSRQFVQRTRHRDD